MQCLLTQLALEYVRVGAAPVKAEEPHSGGGNVRPGHICEPVSISALACGSNRGVSSSLRCLSDCLRGVPSEHQPATGSKVRECQTLLIGVLVALDRDPAPLCSCWGCDKTVDLQRGSEAIVTVGLNFPIR